MVRIGPCACGRTNPRVRCIGRTDDMLIVRGVNVFPTAIREAVDQFAPADLADQIKKRARDTLMITTQITLVPAGTLPRSDYKSALVDWTGASSTRS